MAVGGGATGENCKSFTFITLSTYAATHRVLYPPLLLLQDKTGDALHLISQPNQSFTFFYCVLRNLLLIPSPSSQRCKIKTMRLPVIVCVQPARTETQQTKDDDVLYLNTIQCCREKKRACRFFINHFLINAHV